MLQFHHESWWVHHLSHTITIFLILHDVHRCTHVQITWCKQPNCSHTPFFLHGSMLLYWKRLMDFFYYVYMLPAKNLCTHVHIHTYMYVNRKKLGQKRNKTTTWTNVTKSKYSLGLDCTIKGLGEKLWKFWTY